MLDYANFCTPGQLNNPKSWRFLTVLTTRHTRCVFLSDFVTLRHSQFLFTDHSQNYTNLIGRFRRGWKNISNSFNRNNDKFESMLHRRTQTQLWWTWMNLHHVSLKAKSTIRDPLTIKTEWVSGWWRDVENDETAILRSLRRREEMDIIVCESGGELFVALRKGKWRRKSYKNSTAAHAHSLKMARWRRIVTVLPRSNKYWNLRNDFQVRNLYRWNNSQWLKLKHFI